MAALDCSGEWEGHAALSGDSQGRVISATSAWGGPGGEHCRNGGGEARRGDLDLAPRLLEASERPLQRAAGTGGALPQGPPASPPPNLTLPMLESSRRCFQGGLGLISTAPASPRRWGTELTPPAQPGFLARGGGPRAAASRATTALSCERVGGLQGEDQDRPPLQGWTPWGRRAGPVRAAPTCDVMGPQHRSRRPW